MMTDDDKHLQKKFAQNSAEIIDRWKTLRSEIENLNVVNRRIRKEISSKDEQIKLLTENLDETQQKLFAAEKELELVKKSIKPLDEDECAMMEVYVAKEDAIKVEQIKRVDDVIQQLCKVVKHFQGRDVEADCWVPDYVSECELCDGFYNREQMRVEFRDMFIGDAEGGDINKEYFLNGKTDVKGGVDMLYFDYRDLDDDTYGGYYGMIKDMEEDICSDVMKAMDGEECLYKPISIYARDGKSLREQCEDNDGIVHKKVYENYKWIVSNDMEIECRGGASGYCSDCLFEHYQCVKGRDLDRWKSYMNEHPNHYKNFSLLQKLTGIEVLDIFCDLKKEEEKIGS